MKRWAVRLLATAVLLLVVAGCDWTQGGMNAGHSLYDPSEPALTASTVDTLAQKFSLSVPNTTNAAPIVAGGRLFLTTFDSTTSTAELDAFDAATGATLWTTTLATEASSVTDPVYDNGTIYMVTTTSSGLTANAVAPATGAVEWSVALPGSGVASSLVADQGKVFIPVSTPGILSLPGSIELLALDGATGATVWTWQGQDYSPSFRAVPAVGSGYIALMYYCCITRPGQTPAEPITEVVNESTGSTVNSSANFYVNNGGAEVDMYRVANGLLYGSVTIQNGSFFAAYDPISDWSTPVWASSDAPEAVSNRSAITVHTSDLTAVDATTGASQWTTPWPTAITSAGSPVIAGHLVYVVTSDGTTATLRINDAVTGAAVSSLDLGSIAITPFPPTPIVANGFVYITNGGTITAYAPA